MFVKMTYRDAKCFVCGHVQTMSCNHLGTCFDYCHGCSWKSFGFDSANTANFGGRAYRKFQILDKETYK